MIVARMMEGMTYDDGEVGDIDCENGGKDDG